MMFLLANEPCILFWNILKPMSIFQPPGWTSGSSNFTSCRHKRTWRWGSSWSKMPCWILLTKNNHHFSDRSHEYGSKIEVDSLFLATMDWRDHTIHHFYLTRGDVCHDSLGVAIGYLLSITKMAYHRPQQTSGSHYNTGYHHNQVLQTPVKYVWVYLTLPKKTWNAELPKSWFTTFPKIQFHKMEFLHWHDSSPSPLTTGISALAPLRTLGRVALRDASLLHPFAWQHDVASRRCCQKTGAVWKLMKAKNLFETKQPCSNSKYIYIAEETLRMGHKGLLLLERAT